MATATTTTVLIFLAPADTNLNASVLTANAESTVLEITFPSNSILGANNPGTVTIGPSAASTGSYGAQISVPNTGEVTINCNTSMSTPTACVATGGLGGILQVESTTIPSYHFLPVTITAGQEVLSGASTAVPMSSTTSDAGDPFSGTNAASRRENSPFAAVIALLAVTVGRWLF